MSFFRRGEDTAKSDVKTAAGRHAVIVERARPVRQVPVPSTVKEIDDLQAFGSVIEENQQSSDELLVSLTSLQERVSSLLGAHSHSLNETGSLKAECARLGSLLDFESTARRKADHDNLRLTAENKTVRLDNGQLRVEVEAYRDELVKLQGIHELTQEEFTIIETRLGDAERELFDRIAQYEEATTQLRRTQQELDMRNRELTTSREKLDLEVTAHELLIESSRRESGAQMRELSRLNEERSHLKSSLAEQEALARNLQGTASGLKQNLSLFEERHRRLETEFETLQSSSTLEIAHLKTKHEAVGSKAELVEKLLQTANGRNRMTDEELHSTRAELKRVKAELSTVMSRADRVVSELDKARSSAGESEAARRELAAQSNEMALRLREAEGQRSKRDRELDSYKRDLDTRIDGDRHEIGQLRSNLEVARSEIRQLRAERAILSGQLEVARSDRAHSVPVDAQEPEEVRMPQAPFAPMINISEKSLRAVSVVAGSVSDELAAMNATQTRAAAE